jgi:hypothetical protein
MKLTSGFILSLMWMVSVGLPFLSESIHNFSNSKTSAKEGYHPKNVNLAALNVNCPEPQIFFVDTDCRADAVLNLPVSNCPLLSVALTIDEGQIVSISQGPSGFPATLDTFFTGTDTFSIVWNVTDNCSVPSVPMTCTQVIHVRDNRPPTIECPRDVSVGNRRDMRRGLRSAVYPVLVGDAMSEDNCT